MWGKIKELHFGSAELKSCYTSTEKGSGSHPISLKLTTEVWVIIELRM